jgi:GTPase Era involved in 16S rRNA processing
MNTNLTKAEVILNRTLAKWELAQARINEVANGLRDAIGEEVFTPQSLEFVQANEELSLAVAKIRQMAERPEVRIAATGTTSSGKSTLLNMLIGDDLLPTAVEEKSAGVVSVEHHPDLRQMVVEMTPGATWETGCWGDGLSTDAVRERLHSVMDQYRHHIERVQREGGSMSGVLPPKVSIHWPTMIGQFPERFGLPQNARVKLIDLPGLKFVGDESNSEVLREEARKALCLVTYNAAETDDSKQATLLREVVEQVKNLQGSPVRMLFVLNRIDEFLRNGDLAEQSEKKFTNRITHQIKSELSARLHNYKNDIEKIRPIALSSLPALLSIQAEQAEQGSDKRIESLKSLETNCRLLFSEEFMDDFPRKQNLWTEAQCQRFIEYAKIKSRLPEFQARLQAHVASNLPDILLPDLVQGANVPAKKAILMLDALVAKYENDEIEKVKEQKERLDRVYKDILELKNKNIEKYENMLIDLREVLSEDRGSEDIFLKFTQSHKDFTALLDGNSTSINEVFERVNVYALGVMQGRSIDDDLNGVAKGKGLTDAIVQLMNSPYGKQQKSNSKDESFKFLDDEAKQVGILLGNFSKDYAATVNVLMQHELSVSSDQLYQWFHTEAQALADRVEAESASICCEAGFSGLSGSFCVDVEKRDLINVKFEMEKDILKWGSEWVSKTKEIRAIEKKRIWLPWQNWKDWLRLVDKEVVKTVQVSEECATLEVPRFGGLLDVACSSSNSNGDELFLDINRWVENVFSKFFVDLENGLKAGVTHYGDLLSKRIDELEQESGKKIENVRSYDGAIKETTSSVEQACAWGAGFEKM